MLVMVLIATASTCIRTHSDNLIKLGQYNLAMPEPSGLALSSDGHHLWIVSDQKGQIYQTDLNGRIINQVDIKSSDLEGVAISADGQSLFVLDESKNRITGYDLQGKEIFEIELETKVSNKSGPEGLDIDWSNGHFIVVNEKDPRLLMELDEKGELIRQQEIKPLNDLSAVTINPENKELWILSDEDQKLIRFNAASKMMDVYLIDINQMEGLAIDFKSKRIYIVSDAEEELHIFEYK